MLVSEIKEILKTPFQDWDKCCICKEFKSPLIWIRDPKEWRIYFVCDECYDKIKGAG